MQQPYILRPVEILQKILYKVASFLFLYFLFASQN